jgi:ubiquitin carboxyl-terminal hydrolase 7
VISFCELAGWNSPDTFLQKIFSLGQSVTFSPFFWLLLIFVCVAEGLFSLRHGKYLSPDADRSVRNKYLLHSVLVHSGGVNGGHYYAYIRPDLRGKWFKFDDERVTKEEASKALDEQYGGDDDNAGYNPGYNKLPKFSNAYMLVYVRESDQDQIICDATEEDIAAHLRLRLAKEKEEKERKRKEKAEAHLYTVIKLATAEDAGKQIGQDIFFDLVDHEKCRSFRVEKQTPFADFKRQVAAELGVPVERQRYWLWAKRQNQTFRPNRVLLPNETEAQTVSQVRESNLPQKTTPATTDLKLFLEVASDAEAAAAADDPTMVPMSDDDFPARAVSGGASVQLLAPPPVPKSHILLFFKFYNPRAETLRYIGHLLLDQGSRMIDNKDAMVALATGAGSLRPGEDIALFEEIKYEPTIYCEKVEWRNPLKSSLQLGDGDIICIQPVIPQSEVHEGEVRFGTCPQFLEYIRNRQRVVFRELTSPRDDKFTLDLSKSMTYDAVTAALAEALSAEDPTTMDPTTIRLTTHNGYSQAPKLPSLAYRGVEQLSDMLAQFNSTSDILYYEVLDMPLPELERLKSLKIAFHGRDTKQVETFNIRMPRDSCVADVLEELRGRLGDKVGLLRVGVTRLTHSA